MPEAAARESRVRLGKNWSIRWPSDQLVIGIMLPSVLLATLQLQTLGVAAFAVITAYYTYIEWRNILRNPFVKYVAAFSAYGLFSTVWSLYPGATLYYGAEIILTALAAVILSSSPRPHDTLCGIAISLVGHSILSHLFGHYMTFEEEGKYVFVGITSGKNYYGGISGLTVIFCVALAYAMASRRQFYACGLCVVGAMIGLLGLIRSLAMGFTLSTVACSLLVIYFNVYIKLPNRLRFGITLYIFYAIICSSLVLYLVKDNLLQLLLQITHKDMTFTGRTEIWDIAHQAIEKRPILGMGQSAFWVPGNPYAEQIWSAHNIVAKRGFTLHNTYIDVLTTLGFVGLTLYVAMIVWLFFSQVRRVLIAPTGPQVAWTAVFLFFLLLTGVEAFAPAPMNYYMLFFTAAQTFNIPVPRGSNLGSDRKREQVSLTKWTRAVG